MELKVDLQNALSNEALHDVCLIGSDNIEVPCNKFMLAIRSPVFQNMLFGDNRESDGDSVKLDYHSVVLKTLVKYCYSDVLDFDLITGGESIIADKGVYLLFDLRDAANCFGLSGFTDHVLGTIAKSIFHSGGKICVCAALTSLHKRGEAETPFWNVLFTLATNEPEACLLPKESLKSNKGIKTVPLEILIQILETIGDPYVVACCLKEWRAENMVNETNPSRANNEELLTDLANTTDLKSIPAKKLANLKPCALFSMERLHEALSYRVQNNSPQEDSFLREGAILVSGAGIKSVDGYYCKADQFTLNQYCFKKKGTFESLESEFTLQPIEGRWTISVRSVGLFGDKVLYESPTGSLQSFLPNPSSFWSCVEGASPAPYVVEMEHKVQKPVFQGITSPSTATFDENERNQQNAPLGRQPVYLYSRIGTAAGTTTAVRFRWVFVCPAVSCRSNGWTRLSTNPSYRR